jgi:hypothetical protein
MYYTARVRRPILDRLPGAGRLAVTGVPRMALAPLAVPAAESHGFVTSFLAEWGEAAERPPRRTLKRR